MKNPGKYSGIMICLLLCGAMAGAGLPSFPVTPEWEEGLRERSPGSPPSAPASHRRILVFSLATGFQHWCIPHAEAMVRILGEKSGAYEITATRDIEAFRAENLARYDAVVLNNSCPHRTDRDGFRDVLINQVDTFGEKYKDLPLQEREALAGSLYRSLVDYVSGGGGLVVLHGGITSFSKSDEFSGIVGGSFDFHPVQQDVTLRPVDPGHPLLKPFGGKPLVHHDEPYFFNRAYPALDFMPLLEMDVSNLKPDKRVDALPDLPRYVAWVKRHQKGRVFFCGPSHNAQSFDHPELLSFILGGIQYALGDLDCPDQPLGPGVPSPEQGSVQEGDQGSP